MKRYRRLFALLGLVFSHCGIAHADDTLAAVRAIITNHPQVCGDFVQRKSLRALSRPLLSRGKIRFVAGKGVIWELVSPIATRVVLTENAITTWNDNGERRRIAAAQFPLFKALTNIFLAVFTGDFSRLDDAFAIQPATDDGTWRLSLTPQDKTIAVAIESILITGGAFVDRIAFNERSGDKTVITFANMIGPSCKLTDAEQGYFPN